MPGVTVFPGAIDAFPTIDANTREDGGAGVDHDVVHANVHAALAALESKIGIDDSADATSLDARMAAVESGKLDSSAIGVTVAGLVAGQVPAAQLPSYVDDVLEVADHASLPATGEAGKIYITIAAGPDPANSQYRWSGSSYVLLVASPGSSDAVPEGTSNLYFTAQRVRDAVLTGLSTATNVAIAASDTVLAALGKLQAQITALLAGPLSQFASTTSAQLAGVISDKTGGGALVFANSPTLVDPIVGTQAPSDNSTKGASTAFVAAAVAASGGGGGGAVGTPPLAANFTAFGTGITATDKSSRLQLVTTSVASALRGIVRNSIATPYTVDARITHMGASGGADESGAGLCLSDGTKYIQYTLGYTNGGLVSRIITWATSSSGAAVLASNNLIANPSDFYLRITDDGTTRRFLISGNGKDYFEYFSHATNTYLTQTKFGLCVYNNGFGGKASKTVITNWLVTSSALGDSS